MWSRVTCTISPGRRPPAHCTSSMPATRGTPRHARCHESTSAPCHGRGTACLGGACRDQARNTAR
eukprot:9713759-Alexandrium_andersonii.AAC.1